MAVGREEETRIQRARTTLSAGRTRVTWSRGAEVKSLVLERPVVAGAAASADIVLDDPTVSRLHAELDPRPDGLWVRDLGSRNGTWIAAVRVDRGLVPGGGTLRLGNTELRVEYQSGAQPLWPEERFGTLIGRSTKMRELFASLARVAPSDASVLIHGETGTGKEVVARAIHEASPRASKPLVVVDCGALAESLLDAELFGYAKGAFTGAVTARSGAIEEADGGTVFLDEIGELPLALQPKLLRALESRTIRRLGEVTYRSVDVRFIAATHRGLVDMVAAGDFREDLYFRLAVLPVFVPPLRERPEDIEPLVRHFCGGTAQGMTSELLDAMARRSWRGNVRELRNFVERARTLGTTEALALMDPEAAPVPSKALPSVPTLPRLDDDDDDDPEAIELTAVSFAPAEADEPSVPLEQPFKTFREQWIEEGERRYIEALVARAPKMIAAAKEAGVNRTYLYRLIKKYSR